MGVLVEGPLNNLRKNEMHVTKPLKLYNKRNPVLIVLSIIVIVCALQIGCYCYHEHTRSNVAKYYVSMLYSLLNIILYMYMYSHLKVHPLL